MRIGFAGTPAFAAAVLRSLQDAGFAVVLVLTQPDRPRGRGLNVAPSPVKRVALEGGIPVYEPAKLAPEAACAPILVNPLDVLVVAAYGLILPPAVLAWPRYGCINVHASLLPRWRGAAPIQRALLAGDAQTGVTLMQMDAGLDTGPILDAVRVPIGPRDTAATLEHKLAAQGAACLIAHLRRLAARSAGRPVAQPAEGVTYAAKIRKAEADIDWSASVADVDRQVRAFDPVPGASTLLAGERIKVWRARPVPSVAPGTTPGTVIATTGDSIVVACGDGALGIAELQPAGGRRMSAAAFLAGRHIAPGARCGTEAP
ncbi:MAG: methionyl-tRNA formyltransferase [Betaproteobacteria bacterium]|jgi:methionyl-tRNA formyltransferase|nr:methionyl-tRNA formyltransferase [Betaproteobacteria bacterium]